MSEIQAGYQDRYVSGSYHAEDRRHDTGHPAHADRQNHDYAVAVNRLNRLERLGSLAGKRLLDVGCSNGAFVDAAINEGIDAIGCDLSVEAVPGNLRQFVRCGELDALGFTRRTFDFITMNDVLEHMPDPVWALLAAKGLLRRDGVLVIDVPDMGCLEAIAEGERFHHVKPYEHLWYFTANQLRALLERLGFTVVWMDSPIPGKVVAYASPESVVENVTIYGPPGIGDILWTLCKLRDIRDRESPCRIKYVVCVKADDVKMATRGSDLMGMCGLIDSYDFEELPLPHDVGCDDARKPAYYLIANDHLEPGAKRLEDWRPELATDFDVAIDVPECALSQARMRLAGIERHAALYFSSEIWNHVCTNNQAWLPRGWANLAVKLADSGIKPVVLGSQWDKSYCDLVASELIALGRDPAKTWINLVGRTPLATAMAVMKLAQVTIGICAGLPMIAAHMGWPAIMLWPKRGALKHPGQMNFSPEFQTNWLSPEVLSSGSYVPLSFGEFDEAAVLSAMESIVGSGVAQ